MKLISIVILCIVFLFSMLGYSQFKTTTIGEIKETTSFPSKTVITEGYAFRDNKEFAILVTELDVYTTNHPMRCNEYIRLIGNIDEFVPFNVGCDWLLGTNHVRVKGICVHCYGGDICLYVIWYRLALSDKKYKRNKGE